MEESPSEIVTSPAAVSPEASYSDNLMEESHRPSSSSSEILVQNEEVQISTRNRREESPTWPLLRLRRRPLLYGYNLDLFRRVSIRMREEEWSGFTVLLVFWIFASMTVILGFYGSENVQLGPNCSRLVQANTCFVQSVMATEKSNLNLSPMLYGFYEPPPLDVLINWTETHNVFMESNEHKEWTYYLNKGSKISVSYRVSAPNHAHLTLVIAKGGESLFEWIQDPSYPNTTLSWHIIHGSGMIEQEILAANTYYIAVGNLKSEQVEVQLNFTVRALVYNTTQAYYKCSISENSCRLSLYILSENVAVLTSPGPKEGVTNHNWYVQLSYGPRWISYFLLSTSITTFVILALKVCTLLWITREHQTTSAASNRAPLLSQKDDDLSSWCSSYDSMSSGEEESDTFFKVASLTDERQLAGDCSKDHRRQCVMCLEASRDCFFLPCGHCIVCFTCGTKVMEEAKTCPLCRRPAKKVRKIYSV